MSDAGEFIDAALQRESNWYRADEDRERLGSDLTFYGASVGAIRASIRDASKRYPGLAHDEVTALSSELWAEPVFERRLAAIVLLQSNLPLLRVTDLTRMEGFVRGAKLRALVDPLATDVIGPLIDGLDAAGQGKARVALDRWIDEPDVWLRRAAVLSPLRAFRAGRGDWDWYARRVKHLRTLRRDTSGDDVVREAINTVLKDLAKTRPELSLAPGS